MQASCGACQGGVKQPMPFSMAFQPIVNVVTGKPYAYEALVRGPQGEGAGTVLSQVTVENRYAFDQTCRKHAITLAARLGIPSTGARLSINFLPGAVYSPAACIQLTLSTARAVDFPLDHLIFEITEQEEVQNTSHLRAIAEEYHKHGFQVALDDFGAGYANLNLLTDLNASIVKLDMGLIRKLHERPKAKQVVQSMLALCADLDMTVIAEGIETLEEFWCLRDSGVTLMQGYLLAKPAFEALPDFALPGARCVEAAPAPQPYSIPPNPRYHFPLLQEA